MKRYIILIISVLLYIILATTVNGNTYLYRVAVLPFEEGSIEDRLWGESFQLGEEVADQLVTALFDTKRFRLIERQEINQILKEQNLVKQGIIDPKTAAKIGKILGVQYLVIGRITDFTRKKKTSALGNPNYKNPMGMVMYTTIARVSLDARLVDTTTAEILTSTTGTGESKNIILGAATKQGLMFFGSDDFKKSDMGRALRYAINKVAYQLGTKAYDGVTIPAMTIAGKIAYVGPENVIINVGAKDGVTNGMIFVVRHPTDLVKDPETGVTVDIVSEPVAEIMVAEVKERTATCTILTRFGSEFDVAIKDLVQTKEPLTMVALPPLKPKGTGPEIQKGPSNKLHIDMTGLINCPNDDFTSDDYSGWMSMYGGDFTFNRYKISVEKVISSEISPTGEVDILELKLGYNLNNDSDTKMELYLSDLSIDWNNGAFENSSLMFGADIAYDLAEKTTFEASFGYGFTPSTKKNGEKESGQTNITTAKVKVSYTISNNLDLYAGYRSYMIMRQQDLSLSGITGGLTLKF